MDKIYAISQFWNDRLVFYLVNPFLKKAGRFTETIICKGFAGMTLFKGAGLKSPKTNMRLHPGFFSKFGCDQQFDIKNQLAPITRQPSGVWRSGR